MHKMCKGLRFAPVRLGSGKWGVPQPPGASVTSSVGEKWGGLVASPSEERQDGVFSALDDIWRCQFVSIPSSKSLKKVLGRFCRQGRSFPNSDAVVLVALALSRFVGACHGLSR